MRIKGRDLIMFFQINGEYIPAAYATGFNLDIQAETIGTSSPLTGRWSTLIKRKLSWSGSCSHLVSDIIQEADIYSMLTSTTPVKLCFATVKEHKDVTLEPEGYEIDDKVKWIGEAHITSMSISSNNGEHVTMSCQFVGTGELTQNYAQWILADGTWNMNGVWIDKAKWFAE